MSIRNTIRGRRRGRPGLGEPILPQQFNSAAGVNFWFTPQTPDATVMQLLAANNATLPPDLAAKWAAAQAGTSTPPAVTSAGPVSTQTGQAVTLVNQTSIAPGIFQCLMSDGSTHYCNVAGQPIAYTPPTPATTPAGVVPGTPNGIYWIPGGPLVYPGNEPPPLNTIMANGQPYRGGPISDYGGLPVRPGVTTTGPLVYPGNEPPPPVAVTPGGTTISTTTGQPVPAPGPVPAPASSSWFSGSMFGGIPNWALLGGGAVLLYMLSGEGSGGHHR